MATMTRSRMSHPPVRAEFFVKYVHCQRLPLNGWPNTGEWITSTKELITEGPFDTCHEADEAANEIMFRDTTMPGMTRVVPTVRVIREDGDINEA